MTKKGKLTNGQAFKWRKRKNFTLPQNNDTMKLQKGVTKLGNTVKKNSPEIKTSVPKTLGDHSTVLCLKYIITQ